MGQKISPKNCEEVIRWTCPVESDDSDVEIEYDHQTKESSIQG